MIRPVDDSSWRVASTTVFNGSQENHFDSTSLHLSFTEYYVPMHVTGQQNQDGQIFFLESYVSVHDSGKWVGDINILDAVSSPIIKRRVVKCRHGPGKEAEFTIQPELISVESWHDILDPPVESIVVRANGNRVARLAVSAMLPQILNRSSFRDVVICPQWCCWCCHDKEFPSPAEQHTDQDDYPPWENNTIYIY